MEQDPDAEHARVGERERDEAEERATAVDVRLDAGRHVRADERRVDPPRQRRDVEPAGAQERGHPGRRYLVGLV